MERYLWGLLYMWRLGLPEQPGSCERGSDMTAMISDSSRERTQDASPERSAGGEVVRGREGEQKLIRDLMRARSAGSGGVVLVDGEPGIRQVLLLRDSTDEAAEQGLFRAAGPADQLGRASPVLRAARGSA